MSKTPSKTRDAAESRSGSAAVEPQTTDRLTARFATLKGENRAGLVTFITAGDPDFISSYAILAGLPNAGADLIELGMPFTDPMADGPAIQASSLRALKAGGDMLKTLELVRRFRQTDKATPIVLMGYYNPIYIYGVPRFIADCLSAGVDGLIVVDLPPEEDDELCIPALEAGLHFIRLATPTTDEKRLPAVLEHTSGFIYYVSITGITGAASADDVAVASAVARLRAKTSLPVAVGFGIKTPVQAAAVARVADAAVVGSALVQTIADSFDPQGRATERTSTEPLAFVRALAAGVRSARDGMPAHTATSRK